MGCKRVRNLQLKTELLLLTRCTLSYLLRNVEAIARNPYQGWAWLFSATMLQISRYKHITLTK
jgi:hypothetical protein